MHYETVHAANGVILITTKQAKEGKIRVEYNASFGVQSLAKELELLDAWEYMSYLNEKAAINNQPTIYTDEEIKSTRHSTIGTARAIDSSCGSIFHHFNRFSKLMASREPEYK